MYIVLFHMKVLNLQVRDVGITTFQRSFMKSKNCIKLTNLQLSFVI